MTIDRSAAIAAAEAAVVAANAEVARLTAQLAAEQSAGEQGPRLATWEDGVAAARKRYPAKATAAGTGTADGGAPELSGRALGIAEARRRAARRGNAA